MSMDDKYHGDEIRIEAASAHSLRPLAEAAITAFARAAGGEPADPASLDASALEAFEAAASLASGRLLLRVADAGVEVRDAEAAGAAPLLVWSA